MCESFNGGGVLGSRTPVIWVPPTSLSEGSSKPCEFCVTFSSSVFVCSVSIAFAADVISVSSLADCSPAK